MDTMEKNGMVLPAWAATIRQKYLAGEASVFILYRNVFDRHLANHQAWDTCGFLTQVLLNGNKGRILELSLARGVRLLQGGTAEDAAILVQQRHDATDIASQFQLVERYLLEQPSTALIMPYADSLLPAGESAFLSFEAQVAVTTLHRWSLDDTLANKDCVIFLITESLSSIHPTLLSNPRIAAIELPLPDQPTRAAAISHYAPAMPADQVQQLAAQTAGLRVLHLASIVAPQGAQGLSEQERRAMISQLLSGQPNAEERANKLAAITAGMAPEEIRNLINPSQTLSEADPYAEMLTVVRQRKRELIEKECAGLIEFVESRHGLDVVGGNAGIKAELLAIAGLIRQGDRVRMPMGLLMVGPMGAGKTFVVKAFLKEAGLTGVVLKNFRSKWVGSTESNLERVLAAVKSMGPVALIIDEGDRSFGSASEGDDGTSSRVMARLKEFMSDTDNRGQVLFIMMTNRPDKLDADIKRPGRLDRKIPFFYAETAAERAAIVASIFARFDVPCAIDWAQSSEKLCGHLQGYSNADLEALALLAHELACRAGCSITEDIFSEAAHDFLPPQDVNMIHYMEMLAVFETSRRSLLPERFRSLSPEEVQKRLRELRALVY